MGDGAAFSDRPTHQFLMELCREVNNLARLLGQGLILEEEYRTRLADLKASDKDVRRPTAISEHKRSVAYSPYDLFDDSQPVVAPSAYVVHSLPDTDLPDATIIESSSTDLPSPAASLARHIIPDSSVLVDTTIISAGGPGQAQGAPDNRFFVPGLESFSVQKPTGQQFFPVPAGNYQFESLERSASSRASKAASPPKAASPINLDWNAAALQWNTPPVQPSEAPQFSFGGATGFSVPPVTFSGFGDGASFGQAHFEPTAPVKARSPKKVAAAKKSPAKKPSRKPSSATPKTTVAAVPLGGGEGHPDLALRKLIPEQWYGVLAPVLGSPAMEAEALEIVGLNRPWTIPQRYLTFRALQAELSRVSVVIFGQDPYPRETSATGLAFCDGEVNSWQEKLSPSLRNIIKAACMTQELAHAKTPVAQLRKSLASAQVLGQPLWFQNTMEQGAMWLNTALTFSGKEKPALDRHTKFWAPVVKEIVRGILVNKQQNGQGVVFALWGQNAQNLAKMISAVQSESAPGVPISFAKAAHPCTEAFFDGTNRAHASVFLDINQSLMEVGCDPINWLPGYQD